MIFKIIGNDENLEVSADIEKVTLEWFELDKRMLRKITDKGREVGIILEGQQRLKRGDVLKAGSEMVIIEVAVTKTVIVEPTDIRQMAEVCYELGNRHTVVFLDGVQVLIPYDPTIVELFRKLDIPIKIEKRRLENDLRSKSDHHH